MNQLLTIDVGPEDLADKYDMLNLHYVYGTRRGEIERMITHHYPAAVIEWQKRRIAIAELAIKLKEAEHIQNSACKDTPMNPGLE